MQTVGRAGPETAVPALSVVIPVYGCAAPLRELQERLSRALQSLDRSYEIIYVDDRCNDGSWPILRDIASSDPRTTAVRLSRNFGQHLAITAGLSVCRGQRAVVMDCDLQDPPEIIPALVEEAEKGHDIVYARRLSKFDSWWRHLGNRVYFRLLNSLSRQRLDGEYGTLSIISRKVIDEFLRFPERDRHYLLMLRWMGFDSSIIEFERDKRKQGQSSYTWPRLIRHAFSGLFFTTTRLLNYVVVLGLLMASLGMLLAGVYVVRYFVIGASPGWTSILVSQLMIGGVTIMCIGIAALYIGRIFQAVQQRPLFIVQEAVGQAAAGEAVGSVEPDKPARPRSALTAVSNG